MDDVYTVLLHASFWSYVMGNEEIGLVPPLLTYRGVYPKPGTAHWNGSVAQLSAFRQADGAMLYGHIHTPGPGTSCM